MKRTLAFATLLALASSALAAIKLDPVFTSNMVLQQQMPISFFGTSVGASKITATFHGETVETEPAPDGSWKVTFPAKEASHENFTAVFTDGTDTVKLDDILIGEVWFCSGQSNMAMPIGKTPRHGWSAKDCEKVVAEANYPEIRYAYQRLTKSALKKLPARYTNADGWVKCSPDTAHYFGAAAYFFGLELHKTYNVPVGLINASWGGTRIQPWISYEGYVNAGLMTEAEAFKKADMNEQEMKEFTETEYKRFTDELSAWHSRYFQLRLPEAKNDEWSKPDFNDSDWKATSHLDREKCFVLLSRCPFQIPERFKGKAILLSIPTIADVADVYLNGEKVLSWDTKTSLPRKSGDLRIGVDKIQDNNVLAIRSEHFYGQYYWQQINSITSGITIGINNDRQAVKGWKTKVEYSCPRKDIASLPRFAYLPFADHQFYSHLYNSMVDAWTKLPVRGVIWYQGCSNAGQPSYLKYHKALINDWRAKWNNPDMPFIIVQLAGYEPAHAKDWMTYDPNKPSGYALTRDIQMKMLALKNVGLACTIDIGEAANIHPANKQDVGKRLALEARRIAYGEDIVSQGPIFDKAVPEGETIRVFFKNLTGDLKTSDGKAPGAFAVAGEDRNFFWADAKLDGKTVIVSSPNVKSPKFVRYAYAGYRGDCNLQNQEGLPAYPFLSDADNSNL